jgi:serine/threonine-protein kinase
VVTREELSLSETAAAGATRAMDARGVELTPGDRFRGLRIHALLGAGAMGNAYLASHGSLRTPVVIKLFRVSAGDPLAEAHLAARVVSPAVVPVLDAGVEGGVPYIIQRYVDGIDLEELLRIHAAANRAIPLATLVRIAVNVFQGLAAIHVAGVVHRDIKPPNLFLAGTGDALVGDFGIAVDPNAARQPEVAGTPMFIAPELWEGQLASPRSDLYSTAATLHLLWQRQAAFSGPTLLELAREHRERPYIPPASSDPVAAYFGATLARLLAKDPTQRPESALQAARTLERVRTPPPELRGHADGIARVGDVLIELEQRDIATAETDAIVSAAKIDMSMRKGCSNALRLAAGDELENDAMAQGPITLGQVVWTDGHRLRAKEVAHAAAALDGAICVQRAVLRTLFEAERRGHRSITFPALGTGTGGVPHGLGARLMLETIRTFAAFAPRTCRTIHIALASPDVLGAWCSALVALDADPG